MILKKYAEDIANAFTRWNLWKGGTNNDIIDITDEFTSNIDGCDVYQAFYKSGIVYIYFDVKDDVSGVEMFTVNNPKYYPKIYWREEVDKVGVIGVLVATSGSGAINYYSVAKSGYNGGGYVAYPVV